MMSKPDESHPSNYSNYRSKRPSTITPKDIQEHGKMDQSDYIDYIIDLETLSADEIIKKYC
jgi:hypothetical protein